MILGVGIDLVEIARIKRAYDKFGDRFLTKLYTPYERQHMPGRCARYLAGRFAAKEAAVKALGTGLANGIALKHIEIRIQETGQPALRLYANASAHAGSLGCRHIHLSITHERDCAAAVVIMED